MARQRDYRAEYEARKARGAVKRGRDYGPEQRAATVAKRADRAANPPRRDYRAEYQARKARTRVIDRTNIQGVVSGDTAQLVRQVRKARQTGQGVTVSAWSPVMSRWLTITPRSLARLAAVNDADSPADLIDELPRSKPAPAGKRSSIVRTAQGQWRGDDLDDLEDLLINLGGGILNTMADNDADTYV